MNSIKIAVIISLVIHSFILMIKPNTTKENKEDKKSSQQKESKIQIKQKSQKMTISAYSRSNKPCPKYYIGIGVIQVWGDITDVAKNGPAYRAGIRVDDVLLSKIDTSQLKEGQVIDVSVSRKGIILSYKIKVERICTNNEDN